MLNNHHFSDDESDGIILNQNHFNESHAMDDATRMVNPKLKINYLNVIVVGASRSGKFNFTKFLFEDCFHKNFEIDSEERKFREFIHKIDSGRRST